MIRVDYVCTRDINRVAKIHSSKKYANWNFKIVDGEYRFYPPIKVDEEEDYFDDFEFSKEDDSSWMDNILKTDEKKTLPMFGELWNKTSKFFNETIVAPIEDKKISRISKMGGSARIDKYKDMEDPIKVSKSGARIKKDKYLMFETEDDNYKLYRVKQNRNCLARIDKYKTIEANVQEVVQDYQETPVTVANSITAMVEPSKSNVEVLSMDENLA